MSYSKLESIEFGPNNWCLKLQPIYNSGLLTSLSNGRVELIDWATHKSILQIQTHATSVNDMVIINNDRMNGSLIATAAEDAVKIYDLKSNDCVATLKNGKSAPFLSLDSRHGLLGCGTELSGVDAELHVYDIRSWQQPLRSLVDSHHDDITSIKFHHSDPNVLLSGSTDGYVNIYDLTQQEEEDALHQVINFASIHSCGWLSPKRIYTLSHMETYGIHELNDKRDEPTEPKPVDFGDVRKPWDCNYVIDVYPGFIATGKSEEGRGELKLIPLDHEKPELKSAITIPFAHDDEVVRDVLVPFQHEDLLYSCGEDGSLKVWKSSAGPLNVPQEFWQYSEKIDVFSGTVAEVEMMDSEVPDIELRQEPSDVDAVSKDQDKKRKRKHERHSKDKSKSKTKNSSKGHRYQPY